MLSIADVGWGSVIGNTLDHGVTYMPYMRLCETIKDALDPNGILAPGKSGIWPKATR
jgi:FAD/FMN-containing dehydrogenase